MGDFKSHINTEIIDKTINIIITQIEQLKLKNELEYVTLKIRSYKFPFPPLVIISCGGENIKIQMESIRQKELNYVLDANLADCNITYSNNFTLIIETYQIIITKLKQYNWNSICSISEKFEIHLIK